MELDDRIIYTDVIADDMSAENSIRPRILDEYIGQSKVKENLKVYIEAARERKEALDHVLLYGPPGLGKTTLANIIANEMDVNIHVTSGPAIEKQGDLAAILTNLSEHDVLFIDEIHRLGERLHVESRLEVPTPPSRITLLHSTREAFNSPYCLLHSLRRRLMVFRTRKNDVEAIHAGNILIDSHTFPVSRIQGQEVLNILLIRQTHQGHQQCQRDDKKPQTARQGMSPKKIKNPKNHFANILLLSMGFA